MNASPLVPVFPSAMLPPLIETSIGGAAFKAAAVSSRPPVTTIPVMELVGRAVVRIAERTADADACGNAEA